MIFTDEQIELLKEIGPKHTSTELAAMPEFDDKTRRQIYDKARALGVALGHKPRASYQWQKYTEQEVGVILDGHKNGLHYNVIAEKIGRNPRSVLDKMRGMGLVYNNKESEG